MRFGFELTKNLLRKKILARVEMPWLKKNGEALVDRVELPEEVLDGDGVVTVHSAALKGAGKLIETSLDHLAIKQDRDVMRQVLEALRQR